MRRRWPRLRLLGVALAAVIAIATTPAGAHPAANHPAGAPPAWMPQPRGLYSGAPDSPLNRWLAAGEEASRHLPGERPTVLFVGDSITEWWLYHGRSYWDADFRPIGAVDDGVVGDTTSNLLARIDAGQLPHRSPATVVLMIGTNNIPLAQSPPDIVRGIQAVVAAIHGRLPTSRILLLGLLPRDVPGSPDRRAAAAVDTLLAGVPRPPYVTYLDLSDLFLQPDGNFRPGLMEPDLLHPAPDGYGVMARALLAPVRPA